MRQAQIPRAKRSAETIWKDEMMENVKWDDRWRRRAVGAVAGATVLGTLGLIAPFVFTKSRLPYMATPGRKVFRSLKRALSSDSLNNKVFVDLGSGDGEAVYQALSAGYKQAVGVELNFTLFLFSEMRRSLFWPLDYRQRSKFYWTNFFEYNLNEAGTIMIFGIPSMMQTVSRKLARECKSGTMIVSYRFLLPTTDDEETDSLVNAVLVSEEDEIRVYRVV